MNGRLPAPITPLLTTTAFLLALTGAACDQGGRGPGHPMDSTGGAGGDEAPGDTGGKTGGYVSPDAAAGGQGGDDATGGSMATGGSVGTGGSMGTGGAKGMGGSGAGGSTGKEDAGSGGASGSAPTFSDVYDQIMAMTPTVPVSSCWGPCHAGPGARDALAKINMTTKALAWTGVMKTVVPGNAATSKLYTDLATGKMPQKKPKLPANLIKLVADWINAGAMNN
jgi:hypothetical protein